MNEKSTPYVIKTTLGEEMSNEYEEEEEEKVNYTHIQDMNREEKHQRNHRVSPTQVNDIDDIPHGMMLNNSMQLALSSKRGRKTDREREEAGGRREWNDNEITSLMNHWRENDILYDTNHPLYYVQSERKMVMDQISNDMDISVRDVNDKMHSLRTYYCSQRQRTETLDAKNGNSRALPRWKFYDHMSFLYESVTNRAAKSSMSSTKRGRKPQNREPISPEQQQSPFSMTQRHDSYSPPSLHDSDARTNHLQERQTSYTEERFEGIQNGTYSSGRQPRSTTNGPPTQYQVNSPSSSADNPRKRHLSSEQGYPWSEMTQYKDPGTVASKETSAYKTLEIQLNTADEIFGHMVACSLAQISDDQEKELLKLDIQKMIYNTRFKRKSTDTNGR